MEPTNILQFIQFLVLEVALPLGIVALMHFKLGQYPHPFPLEENKRKDIYESELFYRLVHSTKKVIEISKDNFFALSQGE
jgi:hypothetical protein